MTKKQKAIQLSPQEVGFKQNYKEGWWRIQFYSLVQNILSSLPAHKISEYFSLGSDIRTSSGPSLCLKQVQLEQAAHSAFEYHQGRRVKNLSGPPVSMTPLTVTAFFLILEGRNSLFASPTKSEFKANISNSEFWIQLSEFFIQNTFRLEDISPTNSKGFSQLNFTTFSKIQVK